MKLIELNKGMHAKVDDDDFDRISSVKWSVSKHGNCYYANRGFMENGKLRSVQMHQEILNFPDGVDIDHINGDALDNQKCNLRICSHQQNTFNRRPNKSTDTGYKDIHFVQKTHQFTVCITKDSKKKHIGNFKTLSEAVVAYNDAADTLHGEFAFKQEMPPSDFWWKRAQKVIVDGTGTFSKRPDQFIEGVYPTHCYGGEGNYLITDQGKFFDTMSGLGANLYECAESFTLPTVYEVLLAEKIVSIFPVDKVKFLKTGSEACNAAVRYMRAKTGKNKILGVSYHGWGETFMSEEFPGLGTFNQQYTKFDTVSDLLTYMHLLPKDHRVAGVIIEPVILEESVEDSVRSLDKLCNSLGIPLCLDEIVSGGRVEKFCFANKWNIRPDLMVMGKGLAHGSSLSFVGMKNEMVTPGVFVSTTFSGEMTPIRECLKELSWLSEEKIEKFVALCKEKTSEFNAVCEGVVSIRGYYTRAIFEGPHINLFMQEMCRRGVIIGKAFFPRMSFLPTGWDMLIKKASIVCDQIRAGKVKLEGLPPRPIFKRT